MINSPHKNNFKLSKQLGYLFKYQNIMTRFTIVCNYVYLGYPYSLDVMDHRINPLMPRVIRDRFSKDFDERK